MATYVLVHGAWSGAHGFRRVRPLLREAGHEVFTPSLTGLGERVHLTTPQVCLTTHVQDVVNSVLFEDLDEIVLLGYSYGGMVVTGAVEHLASRIRHLVYLDAFLPKDGENLNGLSGRQATSLAPGLGGEWLVPPLARQYDDAEQGRWMEVRRVPHPARCFEEPVRLLRPLEDYAFTRTYIKATGEPRPEAGGPFWSAADRVRADPHWGYFEIETNHMIPANRPEELAKILLGLD